MRRRRTHKESIVYVQRSMETLKRISFQAFDFGITHRGAVITTADVGSVLRYLRRHYVSVVVEDIRMELFREEELKIYDAITNKRMDTLETFLCQGA